MNNGIISNDRAAELYTYLGSYRSSKRIGHIVRTNSESKEEGDDKSEHNYPHYVRWIIQHDCSYLFRSPRLRPDCNEIDDDTMTRPLAKTMFRCTNNTYVRVQRTLTTNTWDASFRVLRPRLVTALLLNFARLNKYFEFLRPVICRTIHRTSTTPQRHMHRTPCFWFLLYQNEQHNSIDFVFIVSRRGSSGHFASGIPLSNATLVVWLTYLCSRNAFL